MADRPPPPRAWQDAPIGRARLLSALSLAVEPLPDADPRPGRRRPPPTYLVGSRAQPGEDTHAVDLAGWTSTAAGGDTAPLCDCGDHVFSGRVCAHALAALLHAGDARVTLALGHLARDAYVARRLVFGLLPATKAAAAAPPG